MIGIAHRRYLKRLAASMAVYLIALFIAVRFVRSGLVAGPGAIALAILPGVAVSGIFWAVGRLIAEESDEYRRMLMVRQTLVATGFTLSAVTVFSFLESFGQMAQLDPLYLPALWFAGLAAGNLWNRATLGDAAKAP